MEEFVFGTLATDELKLVHHRAALRGLQHAHDLAPRDPLPGEPVTLTVQVGPDLDARHVACYHAFDGTEPHGARGVAHNGHVLPLEPIGITWDTLVWGYVATWQGTLPAQPEGTVVRYQIGAWADQGPEIFADWPDAQATAEQAASAFFRKEPLPTVPPGDPSQRHTFAFGVDRLAPPDWARQAIIYHVFVDRFYPGSGREWLQTTDLRGFCGGTLWGLAEKLDYVAELGANCLWLSPIFPSPTHHGYDATDLMHVEPRLGGDEALRTLVDQAHARGIRVLLDLVCNHISNEHPIFLDARSDPASPYRSWFTFNDSKIGYRTYFNVRSMPQVNLADPGARAWLIDTARYWLREFDVDGYRLDHANGPGPDFWTDFWAACKAQKPDCYCFGEVVDAPAVQRTYVGRLDGCIDFFAADALRRTFALGRWTEDHLERFLERHTAYFPDTFLMPTFLDNHDMDRFLHLAGGYKEALRCAAAIQMRLPGPPIIYYGTEVGLSQTHTTREGMGLHFSRVPMAWGAEQDQELLAYYKALIRERR
jgi:cyclomaltodextrinase / maltogenic alpha-amylase / neopullulanase